MWRALPLVGLVLFVGLGFGWKMETTTIDLAVARHSFSHLSGATSTDDRVVISAVQPF